MRWKIYTRPTTTSDGIAVRWFWCAIDRDGTRESHGFVSRAQCVEDARRNGYGESAITEWRFGLSSHL